jgi:TonB family protein
MRVAAGVRILVVSAVLALAGWAAAGTARAQATEADLRARLVGKPLYLRGMFVDDNLKLDGAGNPLGRYATGPFTVAGIDVDRVEMSGDRMRVEGQRVGLLFRRQEGGGRDRKDEMRRVPLMVGNPARGMSREKISIEIRLQGGRDFGPAVDAVFAENLGDMVAGMPEIWQKYARKNFVERKEGEAEAAEPARQPRAEAAVEAGEPARRPRTDSAPGRGGRGRVTAPHVLQSPDPEFTEWARRMKISGNTMVSLMVDEDGSVSHVSVVRPAGMGLDEKAVEAVQKYKFEPATRDGKPVKVDLNIEVNFQIF